MDSASIDHKAADWLARRDSGTWTAADEEAFSEWQSVSTAHRIAVIRLESVWGQANRLQVLGAGTPPGEIPPPGFWRPPQIALRGNGTERWLTPSTEYSRADAPDYRQASNNYADTNANPSQTVSGLLSRFSYKNIVAPAAAVIAAVIAGLAWHLVASGPNSYRTEIGDIRTVQIADGSKITLNTNSAVHIAFTGKERRVDLDLGEAFFEVAKDRKRPFAVYAAGERIVAVGTKFSVLRGELGTARIVVTEGKVKIEEMGVSGSARPVTLLPAGGIAQSGRAGMFVKRGSLAEAENFLTWRSGYIFLNDADLADAVAQFNRYNKKQLVIGDPSLAKIRIGGNLRATNVDAFVRVLEQGFPVRASEEGDRIVLTGR